MILKILKTNFWINFIITKYRIKEDKLNLQHREMNSYFDDLSSNLSKAINDIDEGGLKTQGLSSINNSREMLQNHISHQMNRLNREFEETRDEFRQRARSLR